MRSSCRGTKETSARKPGKARGRWYAANFRDGDVLDRRPRARGGAEVAVHAAGNHSRGRRDRAIGSGEGRNALQTDPAARRARPPEDAAAGKCARRRPVRCRDVSTRRGHRDRTVTRSAGTSTTRPSNSCPDSSTGWRPSSHAGRRSTRTCRVCCTCPTSSARRKRSDSGRRSTPTSGEVTSNATPNTTAGATTTRPARSIPPCGSAPCRTGPTASEGAWLQKAFCRRAGSAHRQRVHGESRHQSARGQSGLRRRIVTISLLESWEMVFRQQRGAQKRKVSQRLERRSAMILTGAARYDWTHEIPARKTESDPSSGRRLKRKRRVSLTFRRVIVAENDTATGRRTPENDRIRTSDDPPGQRSHR